MITRLILVVLSHTNIELCSELETNIILYVNYTSIFLKKRLHTLPVWHPAFFTYLITTFNNIKIISKSNLLYNISPYEK